MSVPGMGVWAVVLVTDRWAWLVTVVMDVPVLLLVLGSAVLLVAVAWLVRTVPLGVFALTPKVMVSVAVAPLAMVPKLKFNWLPVRTPLPWLALALWKLRPGGKLSVSVTFWASDGPLLLTDMV